MLAVAQTRQAKLYNKGRRLEEFKVGDEVLINQHLLELVDVKGTGRKLVQRRIGPFQITEKINPLVYQVKIPHKYCMHPIMNIEHLWKYHRPTNSSSQTILPNLWELNVKEEYEVEKILSHKWNPSKKRFEYLICWKNYSPEHDTFKPKSNLHNTFKILWDYKRNIPPS